MKLIIKANNVQSTLVGANDEVLVNYEVKDYTLMVDAAAIVTGGGSLMSLFQKVRTEIEIAMTRQEMDRRGARAEADAVEAKINAEVQAAEDTARAKSKAAMKSSTEEMLAAFGKVA